MSQVLHLREEGYDVGSFSPEFLHELMMRHAMHRDRNRHNQALIDAGRNGQKPSYAFIGDTTTSPSGIFRLPPGISFNGNCPGGTVIQPSDEDRAGMEPRSTQAAAHFAVMLGVKNFLVMSAGDSETLPYILGLKEPTGIFMRNWHPVWAPIMASLKARTGYKKADEAERLRLGGIELALTTAQRLEEGFRRNAKSLGNPSGLKITPAFFDAATGHVTTLRSAKPGKPYVEDAVLEGVTNNHARLQAPKAFGCSCCDSRAQHSHIYCTQPGEFYELYLIAAIVPDHRKAKIGGSPSSAWLQIEMAAEKGCSSYVLTGHTKCGGIKALVNWCLTDKPPADPYLAGWLRQAKAEVESVVSFAKENGFGEDVDKMCRMAEMRVVQWSASNIKRYVGARAQVIANYLDIDTRQVYALPLIRDEEIGDDASRTRSLEKTYEKLKELYEDKLLTLAGFYDVPERSARDRRNLFLTECFKK